MTRVAVIGAGAWGTSLGVVLARATAGPVTLWARRQEVADSINQSHRNPELLPGIELPPELRATTALQEAAADVMVVAVPAQHVRTVISLLSGSIPADAGLVLCAKGIERTSGYLMSEVVADVRPATPVAVLSGPSFAGEVARGLPTALALATTDPGLAKRIPDLLAGSALRIYGNDDLIGTQIGGAAKNVLAIACGIAVGAGYGENARATLIARGMAEIRRLGVACGGRPETLAGLAGVGDIVLTCTSPASRNYAFGHRLGVDRRMGNLPPRGRAVVEGVASAGAIRQLARRLDVDMPIAEAVEQVLDAGADLQAVAAALLARPHRLDGETA